VQRSSRIATALFEKHPKGAIGLTPLRPKRSRSSGLFLNNLCSCTSLKEKIKVMNGYVILLRGINVGGKNIIPMAGLKSCLEELGFANVSTYIASGNVILESDKPASEIEAQIEATLIKSFKLDSELIKVLALTRNQLQAVIYNKPEGFGDQPEKYHSDAIFLMGIDSAQTLKVFNPRDGVDMVWSGDGVIYSQRLSAERTKSRLNKIMGSPLYKYMTIRSWNTTMKLLNILNGIDASQGND
jgi:uncharacterized protein (DUF1697 family)